MLELYQNIRKYRIEKELSQTKLAKLTGYTDRSSIAKIESGNVDLPQSKIILFAKALKVTPGDLMGNTGISVSPALRPDEQSLLDNYNKLTDAARKEAAGYIEYLGTKEGNIREKEGCNK